MDKHLNKLFSFRTDNDLIDKLNFISDYNNRTRNKEVEYVLKNYVADFEMKHGKLIIDEDRTVHQSIHKLGRSSTLKSG